MEAIARLEAATRSKKLLGTRGTEFLNDIFARRICPCFSMKNKPPGYHGDGWHGFIKHASIQQYKSYRLFTVDDVITQVGWQRWAWATGFTCSKDMQGVHDSACSAACS